MMSDDSFSQECELRLSDVDGEQHALRVRGRGEERWLPLSPDGWFQLCCYLEHSHPLRLSKKGGVEEDHLFLSEWEKPLTKNAMTLLFHRLRKRAELVETPVSPSALRDTFAVCFLQAGGGLEPLRERLGLRDLVALKRYERLSRQQSEKEQPKELTEEPPFRPPSARPASKRRRRRSLVATKEAPPDWKRSVSRPGSSPRHGIIGSAQDDL